MNHSTKLLLLLILSVMMTNCKMESKSTVVPVYKPRYFFWKNGGISIVDTRDISNVKIYRYMWDSTVKKYVYTATDDTSTFHNLKLWPSNVTDAVGVGSSSGSYLNLLHNPFFKKL
jgi:hypothetical protein